MLLLPQCLKAFSLCEGRIWVDGRGFLNVSLPALGQGGDLFPGSCPGPCLLPGHLMEVHGKELLSEFELFFGANSQLFQTDMVAHTFKDLLKF